MRAFVDLMETGHTEDEKYLAAALQTKDEEASLMMAAKHKELELMAGLLQLREQQIEDLRSLCETQQLEIQQHGRRRTSVDQGHSVGVAEVPGRESQPQLQNHQPPQLHDSPAGSMVVR